MASIIYIADKNNPSGEIIDTLNDLSSSNVIVIGDSSLEGLNSGATLIPYDGEGLEGALNSALRVAKNDKIILMSSNGELRASELKNLLAEANEMDEHSLIYSQASLEGDSEDLTSATSHSLMQLIMYNNEWPAVAIAAKKSTLEAAAKSTASSSLEILAKSIIIAAGNGYSIRASEAIFKNVSEEGQKLSTIESARSLSLMTSCMAIEDLFPEHSWKDFSNESAAACYHTLAALFISLGDDQSATECVRLSEQFEESPRSWALKGLIASNKGETLGAVANLVSSLQQYEERKKSDTHYVSFAPKDLEVINSSLASGLDALNKRDNEKALDFFAQAVFNFDGFYAQFGLDRTR